MGYSSRFYDLIRPGAQASAEIIVPEVYRLIRPVSVVDVGCGEGIWVTEFGRHGAKVLLGVDGGHVNSRPPEFRP